MEFIQNRRAQEALNTFAAQQMERNFDVNIRQVYIYNLIYTQYIQSKAQRKHTFITI
jgi:hypothetical protein